MHFPAKALPPVVNECQLHIKASFSGQFQFPENTVLLSPIYRITCPHKFVKPVTVEIQHCATKLENLQHKSSLTFIVANCTQKKLPYKFEILNGGVFSSSGQYGSIELYQFSGLGLVFNSVMQWFGLRNARGYYAKPYYSSSGTNSWDVHFAITWNLKLHIAVSI